MRLWTTVGLCVMALCLTACPSDDTTPVTSDTTTTPDAAAGDAAADTGTTDATPDAAADVTPTPDAAPDVPVAQCDPPTGARPSRRSEHAGIYDPVGNRVIIYGGSFAVPINCGFPTPTFESEVWAYDIACDSWKQLGLGGGTGPGGRVRHMTAYDSTRHQMVVFGGRFRAGSSGNYTLYNDLWAFDLASETWSNVPLAAATAPSARVNGAFVYDPTGDRLLLFGGNASTSGAFYQSLADVWEYSYATQTWSQLSPTGQSPASRLFTGALWDDSRQWLVVFGGADETAFNQDVQYFGDLWGLDFSSGSPAWAELDAASTFAPKGRFWGGLVRDEVNDRYVMFGGHDNGAIAPDVGNSNDLWTFDPNSLEWFMHTEGDTWNAPALGFCLFPADFTIVDTDLPERRNAHVFVGGNGRAYATGGKTDCGVVDDLWELDYSQTAPTWKELTFATVGEVCWRNSGSAEFCTDMCL